MIGGRKVMQEALFYGFSLERHVPDNHLLRKIDRFVDLSGLRAHLGPYYSDVGRPSIDPELMIRMLIVGYCFGIRSERRLCEEVHLNLAYRWFCLDDPRVNFAISDRTTVTGVDHLGIQVESGEELAELAGRLKAAGEVTRDQEATTCCYAQSDKAWVNDPWPSLGDLPHLW
jgi:hypothetical protein